MSTQANYPARYYVRFIPETGVITGWFDVSTLQDVSFLPPASTMIAVRPEDWADTQSFRLPTGRIVRDGQICDSASPDGGH